MKKLIITIILSILASNSIASDSVDCPGGNCLPGLIKLASIEKYTEYQRVEIEKGEERLRVSICTTAESNIDGESMFLGLEREIYKFYSKHGVDKNIFSLHEAAKCSVEDPKDDMELIDVSPMEAYAYTKTYKMIHFTISKYRDIDPEGLRVALQDVRQGRSIKSILQKNKEESSSERVQKNIQKVINLIDKVFASAQA